LYQTMDSQYNKNFLENLKANYGLNEISLTEVFSNNNGELLYRLDQIR
ncbi:MAG: hypothetical protein JST15_05885, partial [Bacteroidetes bacterium]|nr:hypothetical protein [Bacteroidota bacterium]